MKKIKFITIFTSTLYTLIFFLLLKNSLSYLDPDLGWHLKAGEEVTISKNVNKVNHYNYIFEDGSPWTNHEWFSDFIIFSIYDNYSYLALNIVFVLLIVLILIIAKNFIIKNFTKDKRSVYVILTLSLLGVLASRPHFGIRIQEAGPLFLLLEFIILHLFENRTRDRKNKNYWRILIWLIPLFYFWANMHGSFILGIFILFFYLGVKIIERVIYNPKNKNKLIKKMSKFFKYGPILNNKNLAIFFLFALISALFTLATPYGLKLFDLIKSMYESTAYLKIISEWLPQYYYPFVYWQIIYIGIVLAIFINSFFLEKNKKNINNLWTFSLVLLFIILSIKSKRHFPLLFISSLPFLSTTLYDEVKPILKSTSIKKGKRKTFVKIYLVLIFVFITSFIVLNTKKIENPFSYFCNQYPCQALEFLKKEKNLESAKIFNYYSWGGYLIHEWPEKKIFIDGRMPQKAVKEHSYVEEYRLFFSEEEGDIEKLIEEYEISLFLIKNQEKEIKLNWVDKNIFGIKEKKINNNKNNLIIFLENNNWEKIYKDNVSLVYFK